MSLTFAAFAAANKARCESAPGFNHALASWSLSDWFLAFMGEAGEAANVAKKLNRVRDGIPGNTLSEAELRARFRREIGDAQIYLDLLAQSQGFTLEEAVVEAFDGKSAAIGYPHRLGAEPAEEVRVARVLRNGEMEDLSRGMTFDEVLESASGPLDSANAAEILGTVLFAGSDGKVYTVTTEAVIGEASPEFVRDEMADDEDDEDADDDE